MASENTMWAKTYGNYMDFLKTFSMEDFCKGTVWLFLTKMNTRQIDNTAV